MGTGLPVVIPDNDLVAHLATSSSAGQLLRGGGDLVEKLVAVPDRVANAHSMTVEERAATARASA